MNQLKYIRPEKLAEMVGDENVLEILQSYRDSLQISLKELELSCQKKQADEVRLLAHKMKSSTRFIGADELADMFLLLEQQTVSGCGVDCDIQNLLQGIMGQVGLVINEINNYIEYSA